MYSENKIKKKVNLYTPTKNQLYIHNTISNGDMHIISIFCGRRWGKNTFARYDLIKRALENSGHIAWWCAPVHRLAKRDYRKFVAGLRNSDLIKKQWDSELRIEMYNDTVIEFHGLEEHENLLGEGLDWLYIDEFPRIKKDAWEQTLQPMLMDRKGTAVVFGTPKGKNFAYQEYLIGQEAGSKCRSFQYSSYDNPYLDKDWVKQFENRVPKAVAEQEIYAKFIDGGGSVFTGYVSCIGGELKQRPEHGRSYRIGVDLAKYEDFTVLTIIDLKTREVVNFERFNKLDWSIQKLKIINKAKAWNNADVIIDSTGVGDPIYEDLRRAGLHITPFKFSNRSKQDLIENLMIAIQNRQVLFPDIPELLNELDIFEMKKTPSGNITYSAPSGYHDDCVISLALAIWDTQNIITSVNSLILYSDLSKRDIANTGLKDENFNVL